MLYKFGASKELFWINHHQDVLNHEFIIIFIHFRKKVTIKVSNLCDRVEKHFVYCFPGMFLLLTFQTWVFSVSSKTFFMHVEISIIEILTISKLKRGQNCNFNMLKSLG